MIDFTILITHGTCGEDPNAWDFYKHLCEADKKHLFEADEIN